MVEEFTLFRKSKPVILVAGIILGLLGSDDAPHCLPAVSQNNWRNVKPLFVNQTFNASNTLRSRIASI
jgi:hypothetical protein